MPTKDNRSWTHGARLKGLVFFLFLGSVYAADAVTNATSSTSVSTSISASTSISTPNLLSAVAQIVSNLPTLTLSSTSTCPSRTVNYITHTLPQQCLKANWTGVALHSLSDGDSRSGSVDLASRESATSGTSGDATTTSDPESEPSTTTQASTHPSAVVENPAGAASS